MTAPTTELRFSNQLFASIAGELYRRSGFGATESGCFILGEANGTIRVARDVVYFDDVDPNAYSNRAIHFDTTRLSEVYDLCEKKGLSIVGDIHVHPETAFLSPIDAAHPVIATEGHVSLILPYDGRFRSVRQIAVSIYTKHGQWLELPAGSVKSFLALDDSEPDDKTFDRTELLLLNKNMHREQRHSLLDSIRVLVVADERACETAAGQAALLTSVALCSRFARGGVTVALERDAYLEAIPSVRLSDELTRLGAERQNSHEQFAIVIGTQPAPPNVFAARLFSKDGSYGCVPASVTADMEDEYVPGAIAAAALAVGEVFRVAVLGRIEVAPRERRLKLWEAGEPVPLPERWNDLLPELWLLGFGHLGNAYAWTIALTPAFRPHLYVQDPQGVEVANHSTQLFAVPGDVGRCKVDLAAVELARFGLDVTTDPRGIDEAYQPTNAPGIVLGGLDNVAPRRAISRTNARLIVDGGLGNTETTFSQFAIHTLVTPRDALDVFEDRGRAATDHRAESSAYAEMSNGTTESRCGLLSLANTTVAVPFVGVYVSAIVLTAALRHSLQRNVPAVISGDVLGTLPVTVI